MMGTKVRTFAQLPDDLSLEDLVPKDHFYRRLDARLDLSFVRELVAPLYATGGRPYVDPGQNLKRLLAFGTRSPRRVAQVAALRRPEAGRRGFHDLRIHRKRRQWCSARTFSTRWCILRSTYPAPCIGSVPWRAAEPR